MRLAAADSSDNLPAGNDPGASHTTPNDITRWDEQYKLTSRSCHQVAAGRVKLRCRGYDDAPLPKATPCNANSSRALPVGCKPSLADATISAGSSSAVTQGGILLLSDAESLPAALPTSASAACSELGVARAGNGHGRRLRRRPHLGDIGANSGVRDLVLRIWPTGLTRQAGELAAVRVIGTDWPELKTAKSGALTIPAHTLTRRKPERSRGSRVPLPALEAGSRTRSCYCQRGSLGR